MRNRHRFSCIRPHQVFWYVILSVGSVQENSVSVTNLAAEQRFSRKLISLHKTEYTRALPLTI
jgi:hypothetical protein